MTMAHDPTRHWPLGVGPNNTIISGAAWLELLNGQAFPVVGAGAMVWNGTMWVPVSAQNRLPVEATLSGILAENLATKSYESRVYIRSGTIAAGTTEILIDIVGRECHLEALAMGVDHDGDVLIRIWPYRADGTVDPNRLMVPTHNGNAVGDVNPAILQNHWSGENDFFKVFKFDQQNGRYTIGMKRQAIFANGIRVAIVNTNTTTARMCGVVAMISQWRA